MCKVAEASAAVHLSPLGSVHLAPMIRRLMQMNMAMKEILVFESIFEPGDLLNALFVYPASSSSIVFSGVPSPMEGLHLISFGDR
jgi:hypothetical protein